MQRWTSEPLPVPRNEVPFVEANLEFEDLRHDGPSFSVYLYFNNPEVGDEDGVEGAGYIGRFPIFAHGDCWGDVGHCDLPRGPIGAFDDRPPHPLTPINITVDCTEVLRGLGPAGEATVTALAFSLDPEKKEDILRFGRLTLVTYD
jgi:hypothetical protein